MAELGVAALSHVPSGERVRTGSADPSGAWDQNHPPSTTTTTQESGLRENRTSRLSERTEEGRKPDLLRLYAKQRVDRAVVGNVVAEVRHGRGVDGRDPERVHAQPGEVVEAGRDARHVAHPVPVLVLKRTRVNLVDHPTLPPSERGLVPTHRDLLQTTSGNSCTAHPVGQAKGHRKRHSRWNSRERSRSSRAPGLGS